MKYNNSQNNCSVTLSQACPLSWDTNQMSYSLLSSRGNYMFMLYCWKKMCEKNLERLINTNIFVKTSKSASKALTLLKMAYGECVMKKLSFWLTQVIQRRMRCTQWHKSVAVFVNVDMLTICWSTCLFGNVNRL